MDVKKQMAIVFVRAAEKDTGSNADNPYGSIMYNQAFQLAMAGMPHIDHTHTFVKYSCSPCSLDSVRALFSGQGNYGLKSSIIEPSSVLSLDDCGNRNGNGKLPDGYNPLSSGAGMRRLIADWYYPKENEAAGFSVANSFFHILHLLDQDISRIIEGAKSIPEAYNSTALVYCGHDFTMEALHIFAHGALVRENGGARLNSNYKGPLMPGQRCYALSSDLLANDPVFTFSMHPRTGDSTYFSLSDLKKEVNANRDAMMRNYERFSHGG